MTSRFDGQLVKTTDPVCERLKKDLCDLDRSMRKESEAIRIEAAAIGQSLRRIADLSGRRFSIPSTPSSIDYRSTGRIGRFISAIEYLLTIIDNVARELDASRARNEIDRHRRDIEQRQSRIRDSEQRIENWNRNWQILFIALKERGCPYGIAEVRCP